MKTNIQPILTVDDLDSIPEDGNRYELIEGGIFVSRAPSLTHQFILYKLLSVFVRYLDQNPIGILVPGPGVIFDDHNAVIPDVVFVTEGRRGEVASGDRITGAPDLVVEILSPGQENERRDRKVKRRLYGERGVKEYWIVDPENRAVEVYRLRRRGLELVATLTDKDEITSPILPDFCCKVSGVFEI